MDAPQPCPHCGADSRVNPLDALCEEVARIRGIAEERGRDQEIIASLTHEVQMLRETVARLRGTTFSGVTRPQQVRSPAGTSAA